MLAIDTRGRDRLVVGDLDRRDILEREHATSGQVPDDLGNVDALVVLEVRRERLGVVAFGDVVDLLVGGGGELLEQRWDVSAIADRLVALEPRADDAQRREIDLDDLLDVRPLDLDHDVGEATRLSVGIVQPSPMNLAERSRGKRRLVDPRVVIREHLAQLSLCLGADVGERLGGDFVLEVGEFVGDLDRQHVESCGKELADLDHQPAHADRQCAKAHGDPLVASGSRRACPATQAKTRQDGLPHDEASDGPSEEEDDTPVPCAKLRSGHRASGRGRVSPRRVSRTASCVRR